MYNKFDMDFTYYQGNFTTESMFITYTRDRYILVEVGWVVIYKSVLLKKIRLTSKVNSFQGQIVVNYIYSWMFRGSTNTAVVIEGTMNVPDDESYVEFFTKLSFDIICAYKQLQINTLTIQMKPSMVFF